MSTTTNVRKSVLGYDAPKKAFDSQYFDPKCPFTGGLSVKNETIVGVVVSKDTHRSATIEWERSFYVAKYERYEKRRSRLRVHNPACIDATVGQKVIVARTRPLSKAKNHVIIAVLDKTADDEPVAPKKQKAKAQKKSTPQKQAQEESSPEVEEQDTNDTENESN